MGTGPVTPPDFDPLEGHEKYQRLRDLSAGAAGFVVLAVDKTSGDLVAVKLIERSPDKLTRNVEREILNHSVLLHPHIVRFKECFLTPHYLGIAMEYANGGDMYAYTKNCRGLDEGRARCLFQQLILALDYCHKLNISNRDIKLENALLHSHGPGRPHILKLCDFGYSINEDISRAKTAVGTPGYTAPEVLLNQFQYEGKLADVWSSGVMLFAMLFCRYPFDPLPGQASTNRSIFERVVTVQYEFPPGRQITTGCRDLIQRILVADPNQRLSIADIERHPWFREEMPLDFDVGRFNASYLQLSQADQVQHISNTVRQALSAAHVSQGHGGS